MSLAARWPAWLVLHVGEQGPLGMAAAGPAGADGLWIDADVGNGEGAGERLAVHEPGEPGPRN
jgi:hypothetical protein